jgi:serine/threonine-protein kinase ULK4
VLLTSVEGEAGPCLPFVVGRRGRALFWNDAQSKQKISGPDRAAVKNLAEFFESCKRHRFTIIVCSSPDDPAFRDLAKGDPIPHPGQIIHEIPSKDRRLFVAIHNRILVDAAARCKIELIVIIPSPRDAICVTDHLTICGSPLLIGTVSYVPGAGALYWRIARMPSAPVLLANDATAANYSAARILGAGALAPPSLGAGALLIWHGKAPRLAAISGSLVTEQIIHLAITRPVPFRSVAVIGRGRAPATPPIKATEVERGRFEGTIDFIALKKIAKGIRERSVQSYRKVARRLAHPHVVKLIDRYDTREHKWLAIDLCAGGDFARLVAADAPFPVDILRIFAGDIASGLNYLHRNDIIHRDLGPWNVLMNECSVLKLGDLSRATLKNAPSGIQPDRRMFPYTAPEVAHSVASDIWALGCIMYEMATGRTPFAAQSETEMREKRSRCEFEDVAEYGSEFNDLIRKMLTVDPGMRIGWTDIIAHPFWGDTLESRGDSGPFPLNL